MRMSDPHQNIFEVYVSIDTATLQDKNALTLRKQDIICSFTAALDHWIAERRLELPHE